MDVGGGFKVTMIEQQQFVEYKYKKFLLLNVSQNKLVCVFKLIYVYMYESRLIQMVVD